MRDPCPHRNGDGAGKRTRVKGVAKHLLKLVVKKISNTTRNIKGKGNPKKLQLAGTAISADRCTEAHIITCSSTDRMQHAGVAITASCSMPEWQSPQSDVLRHT